MSLPSPQVIRERIEAVSSLEAQNCLRAAYLFCARISELVSLRNPSDVRTTPRGPKGSDVEIVPYYSPGNQVFEAALFTIHTAKRGGMPRLIGLPLDERYEPWTRPLLTHYQQAAKSESVFPYTRQWMWQQSRDAFKDLEYSIERYKITDKNKLQVVKARTGNEYQERHVRKFRLHALRHLRASELVQYCGFDGAELARYGGWTYRSMGFPGSTDRYLTLNWQGYFPKLLRPRRY